MPSFNSLLAASALLITHLATATPLAAFALPPAWGTPVADLTLPTTSSMCTIPIEQFPIRELIRYLSPGGPLPATALTLKYIALGRGIQNYTCASVGAAPAGAGAIATLYDASMVGQLSLDLVHMIPGMSVNSRPPAPGRDYTLPPPANMLPLLGHHYFAADGTPTFDLKPVGKLLYSAKNGGTKAPANAPKGPAGTGAVDWLSLVAKTDYNPSVGLGQVYRVETAGGNPPAKCTSTAVISVQYAAEYWFYG